MGKDPSKSNRGKEEKEVKVGRSKLPERKLDEAVNGFLGHGFRAVIEIPIDHNLMTNRIFKLKEKYPRGWERRNHRSGKYLKRSVFTRSMSVGTARFHKR